MIPEKCSACPSCACLSVCACSARVWLHLLLHHHVCVRQRWSWQESLLVAVGGRFISTCYRPPSVGPLYNNGTGSAVECKVIDVGLCLARLQTGAQQEVAFPPFHQVYPASSANHGFHRDPILTKCQSSRKTSWQERINTVSWLINQNGTRRDSMKFI